MAEQHFDVLIVGAGLSGVGAAWRLQHDVPHKSFAILEARDAIGGTWDLFRYPGVRSDSDMYTLGYAFKPWIRPKAIADGPSIRDYVRETARENGIDQRILFQHRAKHAAWSSETARWTVDVEVGPERRPAQLSANFLIMGAGYYRYDRGYLPDFPGFDRYEGIKVHPQFWPEDLDYTGKKVVVIGSGATAVTLVPAMAQAAGHVTMLQRSPTYVVSMPAIDPFAAWVHKRLPAKLAYELVRFKKIVLNIVMFHRTRKYPEQAKKFLLDMVRKELPNYDVETHFTPRYNPWDQRLCLVPDSDLFQAIRSGKADVVTGEIETFTSDGIKLKSGEVVPADIVVTATGLELQFIGGVEIEVDGEPVKMSERMYYKGMMFSGVPNLVSLFGYTNASFTLKVDLTCEYVTRMLKYMDRKGYQIATPKPDPTVKPAPWIDLKSGYVERSRHLLPQQGDRKPWRLYQNYALDLLTLRFGRLNDGVLAFSKAGALAKPLHGAPSTPPVAMPVETRVPEPA